MTKKEMVARCGLMMTPWLVDQWREKGVFGKVKKDHGNGKYIYTDKHVVICKNHISKIRALKGE